jgi:hypothetical protein
VPGRFPGAQAAVVVALLGILGLSAILLWPAAFRRTMGVAIRVPLVRRFEPDLR